MLKQIVFIIVACLMITLFGCSNQQQANDDQGKMHTQEMGNQTGQKRRQAMDEKGRYTPESQKQLNTGNTHDGNYTDMFVNQESNRIYQQLINQKEIKQVQVATMDDKVIVAVMLTDHSDHDIGKKIENKVKKIVPNKMVVVYTDDSKWDRMQNLKSRLGPANTGENAKKGFKKLFHLGDS